MAEERPFDIGVIGGRKLKRSEYERVDKVIQAAYYLPVHWDKVFKRRVPAKPAGKFRFKRFKSYLKKKELTKKVFFLEPGETWNKKL